MKEQRFEAGDIVYTEGEAGDAVFIIQDGEIEVLRAVGGDSVRLSVLRKGAIFGEMSVLRDKPRSTTAQALGPVSVVSISKEAFLNIFQRDNPLALKLLRMLCERLSQADQQLMEHHIYSEGAWMRDVAKIRLFAASPETERQIGSDGNVIKKLPYRVGRQIRPGESAEAEPAELALRSAGGEQISPLHFSIEEKDGQLVVRDLHSRLGTLVNDLRIATFEQSDTADLRFGDNPIQTGGLDSPYRFHIIVERKAD